MRVLLWCKDVYFLSTAAADRKGWNRKMYVKQGGTKSGENEVTLAEIGGQQGGSGRPIIQHLLFRSLDLYKHFGLGESNYH